MVIAALTRSSLSICAAAALLTACGSRSSSSMLPTHAGVSSWMIRDASTKDLLYVANPYEGSQLPGTIDLYSYPQGVLEGKITSITYPGGDCSDKNGNVYVTSYEPSGNALVEFAHGGTQPIRTLSLPGTNPFSCAVDPTTGNLAVTNYGNTAGSGASLLVFRKAKGKPKIYTDSRFLNFAYATYDNAGNLFIDGKYPRGYTEPIFAEIPRGTKSIDILNLNYTIGWLSSLQWDGKYLAVGQAVKPYIFRFKISGTSGTQVGSTPLSDATTAFQFVLDGKHVIVANQFFYDRYFYEWDVLVYDYPQGGNSTERIAYDIGGPAITSIALSRHR